MTRENRNVIDLDQLAREAELRWRVHALNRHVLGEPDASRPNPARIALWLGLLCILALVVWAVLVKLFGAAFLALCVLMRFWLLAAVNLGLVAAFLTMTAMGVFDPNPTSRPELPIEAPVDVNPADQTGGTDR